MGARLVFEPLESIDQGQLTRVQADPAGNPVTLSLELEPLCRDAEIERFELQTRRTRMLSEHFNLLGSDRSPGYSIAET